MAWYRGLQMRWMRDDGNRPEYCVKNAREGTARAGLFSLASGEIS
jgi:hypothetical protein